MERKLAHIEKIEIAEVLGGQCLVNSNKNSLYWRISQKYLIEQILRNNPTLTIQGEQGGINVQGNKYDN